METSAVTQRSLAVAPARSTVAVALVETAYLGLRLAAIAILASPLAIAAFLLIG